ncbi:hypothetical protein [Burkholderia oklahomensis]|uniref:hypothetical protein n=1 Tax=Burkholderia oklahomensis TaxID=342113 RepID=UPI001E573A24|nr:hypothetical protein [Burkholderia oklahomensis]
MKIQSGRRRRICQGDIFREVECIERIAEKNGVIEVHKILFPLIIVLTQDCDLEQDANNRKKDTQNTALLSVLVAPLYNAEHVFQGEHLSDLGLKMAQITKGRTPGIDLMRNEKPRYHYVDFPDDVPLVPSIADFKHYFSVHVSYLESIRKTNFVCRLSDLFREDVSQRFSAYLGRIGLPLVNRPRKQCTNGRIGR